MPNPRLAYLAAAIVLGSAAHVAFALSLRSTVPLLPLAAAASISILIVSTIITVDYRSDTPEALSLATHLTIFRGYLSGALLLPLVLQTTTNPVLWIATAVYGCSVMLDYLDGTVARYRGNVTPFGTTLDMRFDSTGMLIAAAFATLAGVVHPAYLLVGLARYLFLAAVGARRLLGYSVEELDESSIARGLAGLQMAFLTAAFIPTIPSTLTALISIVLVIPTAAVFTRDYLRVAGYGL